MKEDLKDLYQLLKDAFKFFFEMLKAGEFTDSKMNTTSSSDNMTDHLKRENDYNYYYNDDSHLHS